jgi:hypothetical protein
MVDLPALGEGRQRLGEQVLGVASGLPDVEAVARFETGVEDRRQPFPRLLGSCEREGRR